MKNGRFQAKDIDDRELLSIDELAAAAAAQPPVAVLVGIEVEAKGDPSQRRATVTLTAEARRFGFHFGKPEE